jgi:hypothetical protein
MDLSYRTANRATSDAHSVLTTGSLPYLFGLICASAFLVSCAIPETLGDKEEYARLSGKGAVVGIHQGLESIDDPVVNKLRTTLLEDEVLQRRVTELTRAAVVGARQGIADTHPDQSAAAITEAVASVLDRHLEQTAGRVFFAAGSTSYSTTLRTVRDSVLVAANSFEIASPRISAGARMIIESSVDGALAAASERFDGKTRELVKEEMLQYVSGISRTAARQAVGGFKQGLTEEFPEFFPRPRFWSDWVQVALVAGAIVLFLLLVVAGIVIVQLARSYRLGRQALVIMAQNVERHGSPELKAAIYQSAGPGDADSWLAAFLRKWRT